MGQVSTSPHCRSQRTAHFLWLGRRTMSGAAHGGQGAAMAGHPLPAPAGGALAVPAPLTDLFPAWPSCHRWQSQGPPCPPLLLSPLCSLPSAPGLCRPLSPQTRSFPGTAGGRGGLTCGLRHPPLLGGCRSSISHQSIDQSLDPSSGAGAQVGPARPRIKFHETPSHGRCLGHMSSKSPAITGTVEPAGTWPREPGQGPRLNPAHGSEPGTSRCSCRGSARVRQEPRHPATLCKSHALRTRKSGLHPTCTG